MEYSSIVVEYDVGVVGYAADFAVDFVVDFVVDYVVDVVDCCLILIRNFFENHRCVPKIASPETRSKLARQSFEKCRCDLKSPRRRREHFL